MAAKVIIVVLQQIGKQLGKFMASHYSSLYVSQSSLVLIVTRARIFEEEFNYL